MIAALCPPMMSANGDRCNARLKTKTRNSSELRRYNTCFPRCLLFIVAATALAHRYRNTRRFPWLPRFRIEKVVNLLQNTPTHFQ
jgi:hypothetical protein